MVTVILYTMFHVRDTHYMVYCKSSRNRLGKNQTIKLLKINTNLMLIVSAETVKPRNPI